MNPFTNRVGTPTNLPQGATYDLLQIKFVDGFPEGRLAFALEDTPRKVTGIQKVAQVFLKLLFTSKGSNVIHPMQGTMFSDMVVNSNIQLEDAVFKAEIMAQIQDAESQTKAVLNTIGSDPASMLRSITIIGLEAEKDSMSLFLRVLTEAGEQAQLAVPFPELDFPRS